MEALFLLWNQQAGTLRRPAFQNLMRTLRILQRIFLLLGDIDLNHTAGNQREQFITGLG
ncbi:Uncharacterised protein [Shigella sonnei]|nr:Uncharacterised protein [Shigella sonnei]